MPERRKWSIGDRVVCTCNHPDGNYDIVVGSTGTICSVDSRIGVCWDDKVDRGHDCACDEELCKYGHGWWVDEDQIEPEADDGVVFEFDEEAFNKLVFGGQGG